MDWLSLWRSDLPWQTFPLGGSSHLITLAVLGLLVASFPFLRGPKRATLRTTFRYTAAGLLLGCEALLHLWSYANGRWSVHDMLPLQLCTVSQYLAVIMLLTRSERLYQYVYYMAIAGALPALLTPEMDGFAFPHFRFWEYMIIHVLIVSAPLYMTFAEGCRPRPGSVWRVIVAMNVLAAFAGLLNRLIGSNYMFLAQKPLGPTPFDYLGEWPWYILGLEGMGIVAVLLLYSPFAVGNWRARRRAALKTAPSHPASRRPAPRPTPTEAPPASPGSAATEPARS